MDPLSETDGSKACRRNIMALSSVLVVAGLAGADPRDLSVFGVKPGGDWGVVVIGAAAISVQVYWYVLRYLHLKEDAVIEQEPVSQGETRQLLKIRLNDSWVLRRKSADWFSNWIAVLLTISSWCFVVSWIAR